MGTGWNEIDEEAANVITSLEEGYVVSSDLVRTLEITKTYERNTTIGDNTDQRVRYITGETPQGGRHQILYWYDPKVTSARTGELHDWDHAVLTKRWRKRDRKWMNNSNNLTEIEVTHKKDEYYASMTGGTALEIPKDEYETREEAREYAKAQISAGGFELIWDADPEVDVEDYGGDNWHVSVLGAAGATVLADSPQEAIEKAKSTMHSNMGDLHSLYVSTLENEETGEVWYDEQV